MRSKLPIPATITIDRAALKEMRDLAVAAHIPEADKLTYEELQQVLTLHSLLKLFTEYGLEAPYVIDISRKEII
jgi:hypothetical protein